MTLNVTKFEEISACFEEEIYSEAKRVFESKEMTDKNIQDNQKRL